MADPRPLTMRVIYIMHIIILTGIWRRKMRRALLSLDRLVQIMKRLRDPVSGCEWDSVQTFATIAPYTIEEAYEVADAIARDDMDALADELGDLQLQVVFHSQMAEEAGQFTLDDVLSRISRQDGTPTPAHLRRCRAWRPSSLGNHQGRGTRGQSRQERAGRRGAGTACPRARREAAAARGPHRLRLAGRIRSASQDRRGAGRARARDRA